MKTETVNKWRFQLLLAGIAEFICRCSVLRKEVVPDLVATAVTVFAVASVSEKRGLLVVFSLLAVAIIAGTWYAHWFPGYSIALSVHFLDVLFLALVVGAILAHVFRSTRITRETIAGAICAYLLIGSMWAHVFSIVENVAPGSFADNSIEADAASGPEPIRDQSDRFTYFSFVTLTTLGYGDMTPLTRPAKNLAALEAIFGQLYLAVLIARLVGQQALRDKEARRLNPIIYVTPTITVKMEEGKMKRFAVILFAAVAMMGMGVTLTGCGSTTKTEIKESPKTTLGQELIDLEAAYNKGVITKDEYEKQKKALLKSRSK